CTASLTSDELMPTSSGLRCCQSNRSGKYAAFSVAATPRCGTGGAWRFCAMTGVMIATAAASGSARLNMKALLAKLQYRAASRLMRRLVVFACLVLVSSVAPAMTAEKVSLEELLDKAAWYLDYFVDQFENVVAEESYVQDANTMLASYTPLQGRGASPLQSAA